MPRLARAAWLKAGAVALASAAITASSLIASPTVASASTAGIFPDDLQPQISGASDVNSVELGVRFSPQEAGSVTALQFYQSSKDADVSRVTLWSPAGTALATVAVQPDQTVGWRTIPLATAVEVTPGQTYVASYHAPNGGYVVTQHDLVKEKVVGDFSLPAEAGVFHYGDSPEMPTSTYEGSNYMADVVFEPGDSSSNTPPPVQSAPGAPAGAITALGRSFPSPATTGVPAGTPLTPYTGPCTIQTPDAVIDAKTVNCDLRILAKGVTITRSKINGSVYADYTAGNGSFTITDSTVDVGDWPGTGIGDAYFTATRVHVMGGSRSINCYANCTVRDSYVADQYTDTTGVHHESGIRVNTNSRLIHNTIGCTAPNVAPDAGCSAAITGYPDFDPVTGNIVDGNLILAGSGGYCSYGGSTAGKPYSGQTADIRFTNNVYQAGESGQCGYWGAITSFDSRAPGNVWSNNLFDDGRPVSPSN